MDRIYWFLLLRLVYVNTIIHRNGIKNISEQYMFQLIISYLLSREDQMEALIALKL